MNTDLNMKHLEYFVKVAQLGSINKAAQALFISQPYLGKIIRELEEEFGYLLLKRGSQGVTLTPEGEEFMRRTTRILEELRYFWHPISGKKEEAECLSVSMTKFSHVMESFIEVVLRHSGQPTFTHRLYEGSAEEVIEDVCQGRAEAGIFHFDSKKRREMEELLLSKRLVYRWLAYAEPHVVISKNHPLVVQNKPINLKTLSDYGVIRYLGQFDDLIYSLRESETDSGCSSRKVIYLSARESLMRLISESDFYSIGIHDFELQDSAYQAISIPISGCDFRFEFGYVIPEGAEVSEITLEFLDNVKKRLQGQERIN